MDNYNYYGEITFASKGLDFVKKKIAGTGIDLIKYLPEATTHDGLTKFTIVTLGCKTEEEIPTLEAIAKHCRG